MESPEPPDLPRRSPGLEVWAGVECSRVRVGRRIADQLRLTGHWDRPTDIELIGALGVKAVRYPVLWEHVAQRGLVRADWSWPDERLGRLRELGVRPVVGLLHHGSGPPGMSIAHPSFPAAFARYAQAVARRYPWVEEWLPINEPLTTARFAGLYGWWHPHRRSAEDMARLLLAQCAAIRGAARAIKAVNPIARVIVNEDVGRTFSTEALRREAEHLNERRWLTWDVLLGRVTAEHPLHELLTSTPENARLLADLIADPEPPEVIGVDHYVTSDRFLDHRLGMYLPDRHGADRMTHVDVEACRVPGTPTGSIARAISDTWRRYRRPMALAEVSLSGEPADEALWWNEAWQAAIEARRAGIDLRAVTAWAAFGGVDWHCLMRHAAGVYAPGLYDVRSDPPRRRPVADAVRRSAEARGRVARRSRDAQPAAAEEVGWWLRPNRFLWQGDVRR